MKNVDVSTSSPLNRFTDEAHLISTAGYPSRKIVTPDHIPFFQDSLVLEHISDTGVVSNLIDGVHYRCIDQVNQALVITGKEAFNKVLLLDAQISGTVVFKQYQVFTVPYTTVEDTLVQTRDMVAGNTDIRHNYNDHVNNKPAQFNPKAHSPAVQEFVGFSGTKDALDGIVLDNSSTEYLELPILGTKLLVGQSDLKLRNTHTTMSQSECGTGVSLDIDGNIVFSAAGSTGQAIYQSPQALISGHISVDMLKQKIQEINTNGY